MTKASAATGCEQVAAGEARCIATDLKIQQGLVMFATELSVTSAATIFKNYRRWDEVKRGLQ